MTRSRFGSRNGTTYPEPVSDLQPVTEGVFFTMPAALPRGKHALPREQVIEAQRERMLIAVTELLAARGPREIGPKDVCTQAGLSLSAFYGCFDTKEDCVFAAYDRFIEVLLTRLLEVDAAEQPWEQYVDAIIHAYLDTLGSDLVVARAFQVEMDALGAPARRRRREALSAMADLLRHKHIERDAQAAERLPFSAYLAGVYGVRQLASDELEQSAEPALSELASEAASWVAELFGITP